MAFNFCRALLLLFSMRAVLLQEASALSVSITESPSPNDSNDYLSTEDVSSVKSGASINLSIFQEANSMTTEIIDENRLPSFKKLIEMDDEGVNPEEIGCYFKSKVSKRFDFYNGSFHIEEGLLENVLANLTGDCFNNVDGDDFGCMHLYRIFSCFKVYAVKGMNECSKLAAVYHFCRSTQTKNLKCLTKCFYEQMHFFEEGTSFNITAFSDWFKDHLPPQKGLFVRGILQSCYNKSLEKDSGSPNYDCNYFYRYSSCFVVNLLKGVLDMAEQPPSVKGFKFHL